jgi:hypothetical protein
VTEDSVELRDQLVLLDLQAVQAKKVFQVGKERRYIKCTTSSPSVSCTPFFGTLLSVSRCRNILWYSVDRKVVAPV